MLVEIWSDVVCPWCYIGKRQFEEALERLRVGPDPIDEPVEVVYRAYQLDPRAPVDSATPVAEVYARKFGGPDRAASIIDHLTETAAAVGLDFRFDLAVRANTMLSHRVLWWVQETYGSRFVEAQSAVKEALLRAYFTEGGNIGDVGVVGDVVGRALSEVTGEPPSLITKRLRDFVDSGAGSGEVTEQLATAAAHGITAVPTYVIDGRFAVPGAQDPDTFERVLRRCAERGR